jgi:hypothetical protein
MSLQTAAAPSCLKHTPEQNHTTVRKHPNCKIVERKNVLFTKESFFCCRYLILFKLDAKHKHISMANN